jgi:hypothetical protein
MLPNPNTNPDDTSVAINIKGSATPNNTYYCNWCNRKLFYREQDKDTGKHVWFCTFCTVEFIPDNQLTKRKSVLKAAGPDIDFYGNVIGDSDGHRIPITTMDVREVSSTSYTHIDLPKAYKALKGYTWTSFEER